MDIYTTNKPRSKTMADMCNRNFDRTLDVVVIKMKEISHYRQAQYVVDGKWGQIQDTLEEVRDLLDRMAEGAARRDEDTPGAY